MIQNLVRNCRPAGRAALVVAVLLVASNAWAVSVIFPQPSDYGGTQAGFTPTVDTMANPYDPALTVSVLHAGATINTSAPTIFFAHGYPVAESAGKLSNYQSVLNNLAYKGYNVVFSPYEGGSAGVITNPNSPSIATRYNELTSGFEAAVSQFNLNTAQVGFVGHSWGAGALPYIVQHEMMGVNGGNHWGGTSAFMFSMAPAYTYNLPLGQTPTQAIQFPANINVDFMSFYADTQYVDPRLAIDQFDSITVPNSQKDFLTLYSDNHGSPNQIANHFVPNDTSTFLTNSTGLTTFGVMRHLDALAAYTFTGDLTAKDIALGNGSAAETYMGTWSDGVPITPASETDNPNPNNYPTSPGNYNSYWTDPDNPRFGLQLAPEPSSFALGGMAGVAFLLAGMRRRNSRRSVNL